MTCVSSHQVAYISDYDQDTLTIPVLDFTWGILYIHNNLDRRFTPSHISDQTSMLAK
jgi:hypothetical protein